MKFRQAVLLIVVIEVVVVLLGLWNYGAGLEGLQAVTRFSGRSSLAIFSLIFLLHHQKGAFLKSLLSNDYFFVFAIAHGIHLIELLSFVYISHAPVIPYRVAGGFLAYSFIFAMPFVMQRHKLGKIRERPFSILANVYLYYVWLIFFMTYFSRVQGKVPHAGGSHGEHVAGMVWVLLLLTINLTERIFFTEKVKKN